jgi:hypothetical protein
MTKLFIGTGLPGFQRCPNVGKHRFDPSPLVFDLGIGPPA